MIFRRSAVILVLICLVSAYSPAQKKPQDPKKNNDQETLRIETEIVQLEVTVTDKQGKLVKDLKREDFELKEDGKVQDISYFTMGTSGRPARWITTAERRSAKSQEPPTTLEPTVGRYFILAVDDYHLAFSSLTYAKTAMHKFVDEQMSPEDQVALITTSGQLAMYQQFTKDREELKRAIDRLTLREMSANSLPNDIPRITPYQAELIDSNMDPDALAIAVNEIMRQIPGTTRPVATGMAQAKARQMVAQNVTYTKATLGTLDNIIKSLKGLPGRKSMVLVSDGFLLGGSSQSVSTETNRIIDSATRAGLVIYAIDARGLVAMSAEYDASQPGFGQEQPPGARSRIERTSMEAVRDGMNALSRDTGGFPIFNNNDLTLGFKKIIDDTETYYLLAFEPSVTYRDGRYRKLEVHIKDHPEYKVRSSHGYFAPDDKALAKAAEKDAKQKQKMDEERSKNPLLAQKYDKEARADAAKIALSSLYPLRGIPVEMSVDYVDSGKGSSFALILAHLKMNEARFQVVGDRYNADIEVFGAVYNEKGDPVDSFSQTAQMRLKRDTLEQILGNGLVFQRRIQLNPGHYQVRLGIRNAGSSQLGSNFAWVDIPDMSKKSLVLSSIFLATEKDQIDPLKDKGDKRLEEQAPAKAPTQVAKTFKRGDKFDYTVFAYNVKQDKNGNPDAVVQTQVYYGKKIVMASPVTKMTSPAEVKDGSFLVYAARISTNDFEPGTYELKTVVLDRLSKTSVTRMTQFRIEQ